MGDPNRPPAADRPGIFYGRRVGDGSAARLYQEGAASAIGRLETRARKDAAASQRAGRAILTGRNENMANKHIGSSFDDFLADEGRLEEATAAGMKRIIAWQIEQEMKAQKLTKTAMAERMHTSRAALNRLLDKEDTSLTLITLASALTALGKRMEFKLAA